LFWWLECECLTGEFENRGWDARSETRNERFVDLIDYLFCVGVLDVVINVMLCCV